MHGRDHVRSLDESERRRPHPARAEPAHELLKLQRSAGNQAVSALLARSPDAGAPVQEQEKASSGAKATLSDIGTIPLLSIALGTGRGPTGGSRGEAREPPSREIGLSSKIGVHSVKLHKAMLDGKAMTVEVTHRKGKRTIRLTLEGAIVSSYSTSGTGGDAIESWSLNFTSIQHSVEGESVE